MSIAQFGGGKAGKCPARKDEDSEIECSFAESGDSECVIDSECNGTRKCCEVKCGFKCLEPAELPKPREIVGPAGDPGQKGEPVRHSFFLLIHAMANPYRAYVTNLIASCSMILYCLFQSTGSPSLFRYIANLFLACKIKPQKQARTVREQEYSISIPLAHLFSFTSP